MASNTVLNSGTGGDTIATKERAHDGDATKVQVVTLAGVSGTEGSYTFGDIGGDASNGLDVDVTRSALPTGASTSANQTTIIGLLTTIDADTSNLNTAIKTEDAAHSSGDTGFMSLAVRRDADTSLVGADGDYAPLQVNASGSLKVAITAGAGSGGTSIADGASFTRDTTSITPAGAVVETSAPTLTNGDVAGLSMTTAGALRVALSSGGITGVVEDAASAGGEEGVLILGVRRDTAASSSGTDGDYSTLNTDANGRLHTIAAIAASQTLATVTTVSTVTNVATIGTSVTPGTAAANLGKAEDAAHTTGDTGVAILAVRRDTAASGAGTDGDYATINVDSVGAQWVRSTGELADDAAFTPGTSRVMPIGLQADETATDSVDEGDIGAPRMTLDRKQIVTQYAHAAAGGCTPYKNLDVDETEDDIKTSAGKLFWLHVMNLHASAARYLKIYDNVSASVTVGTTTPVLTYPIPGNTLGFTISFGPQGTQFSTGICIAATTGLADNDTGAPGSNEVVVNAGFI